MKNPLLVALFLSFFNQTFSMDELDSSFGQNMRRLSPQRRALLPIPGQAPVIFAPIIPVAQRIQLAWIAEINEKSEGADFKFLKKSN